MHTMAGPLHLTSPANAAPPISLGPLMSASIFSPLTAVSCAGLEVCAHTIEQEAPLSQTPQEEPHELRPLGQWYLNTKPLGIR